MFVACARKICMQLAMAAPDVVKSCLTGLVGLLSGPAKVTYTNTSLLLVFGGGLCAAYSTTLSVVTFSFADI